MMKIAGSESASGSGSISQRHGSAGPDPDPHQNVMDPQHAANTAKYKRSVISYNGLKTW
jgi:hypothetical protein